MKMIGKDNQIWSCCIVNTSVFFVLFFLLFDLLHLHYLLSTTFAYIVATINSFMLNRSWTFESYGDSHKKFLKFFIVNVIAVMVNSISMFILVDIFSIHPWISQLFTICLTMCVNYVGNRFWTFTD
jgi:putative flippase GtrA